MWKTPINEKLRIRFLKTNKTNETTQSSLQIFYISNMEPDEPVHKYSQRKKRLNIFMIKTKEKIEINSVFIFKLWNKQQNKKY